MENKSKDMANGAAHEGVEAAKPPDVIERTKKSAEERWTDEGIGEEKRAEMLQELLETLAKIQSAASEEEKLKLIDDAYLENLLDEDAKVELEKKAVQSVGGGKPEATVGAEANAGVQEVVAEIAQNPAAMHEAVEAAAPNETAGKKAELEQELTSKPAQGKLAEKIKDALKRGLPRWGDLRAIGAGAAVGGGARFLIRNGIRLVYGNSLGMAAVAGGIAGATVEGVREYVKETGVPWKRKFSAESVIRRFKEMPDLAARTAAYAKAEKAHKEGRIAGNKEERERTGGELRTMRNLINCELAAGEESMEKLPDKDKIINILKIVDGSRKEISITDNEEAQRIIDNVLFERAKADRKKIARAALRGAIFGLVGGLVGAKFAEWISDHIHHAQEAAPAAHQMAGAVTQTAQEEMLRQKTELAARAARAAAEDADKALMAHDFSGTIEKGQGITHAARQMIHNFLVNEKNLRPEAFKGLSMEQLVHAEDTATKELVKSIGHDTVNPGDHFEMSGSRIAGIVQKSRDLTAGKIENITRILQEPAHHLSRETVTQITNFDQTMGGDEFYRQISEKTAASIKIGVEEAVKSAAPPEAHPAPSGATASMLKKIGVPAAILAAGGLGVGYTWRQARKNARERAAMSGGEAAGVPTAPAETRPVSAAAPPSQEQAVGPVPAAPEVPRAAQPEAVKKAEPPKYERASELKPPTPEDSGEHKEARGAALITLELLENFDEKTLKDDEKFKAKTREFWSKIGFAVHGSESYGPGGKSSLKKRADLDGRCAGGLLRLAGMDIKAVENVEYIKQGKDAKGKINIDTGDKHGIVVEKTRGEDGKTIITIYIDHHADESGRDTSSTKLMYEALAGLGLLEKNDVLDKLVEFVTQMDNKTFPYKNAEERLELFKQSSRTLLGLWRFIKFDKLVEFFKEGKSPADILSDADLKKFGLTQGSKEQESGVKNSIDALGAMKEDGLIVDSERYGKIVFDFGNMRQIPAGFDAAVALGFNTYIIWDPEIGSFFITSEREITDELPQGFLKRKHMWMKPRGDGIPLIVSLEEILRTMTDEKFEPSKVFKALVKKAEKAAKKKS